MQYEKTILLRDGRRCLLRGGREGDGEAVLALFRLTHEQTDYLLSLPGETVRTAADEDAFLRERSESDRAIELLAEVDGKIVASAGVDGVGNRKKLLHRAEFGISVEKDYWRLGIGRALTEACIECALRAGYRQMELEVVADNAAAIALYRSVGFVEYGRNPLGFLSPASGFQEILLMRLDLRPTKEE